MLYGVLEHLKIDSSHTATSKTIDNPKLWDSNILINLVGLRKPKNNFPWGLRVFFFYEVSREGRGIHPTSLDKWLKKATPDDTGLTRPPTVSRVSTHKDEVRSIDHGYFQSQLRVPVYKEVGRPTQDSIKRQQTMVKVTNVFMTQYIIPIDTNQLSKLPSRTDVEVWLMRK